MFIQMKIMNSFILQYLKTIITIRFWTVIHYFIPVA